MIDFIQSHDLTPSRYRLFIDDIGEPPSNIYVVARSCADENRLTETRGCPDEISFDHDLRSDDTAMLVAKRLVEKDLDSDSGFMPRDFKFAVHSANPVGREISSA
ncbi:cyclic-phosphate processing receiver domain-containing protein [Caballeronia sp. SBC2]|uniref:cyclic-phosphate processing receiver domain-containing protein n=1 Tax=Caballeronia sp. SBC2 TaxID=2705547 RepID=UPI003519E0FE